MNRRKLSYAVSAVSINLAFLASLNLAFGELACSASRSDEPKPEVELSAPLVLQAPENPRVTAVRADLNAAKWTLHDATDEGTSYAVASEARVADKTYRLVVHAAKVALPYGTDLATRVTQTYRAELFDSAGVRVDDPGLLVQAALSAIKGVGDGDMSRWAASPVNGAALAALDAHYQLINATNELNINASQTRAGVNDCTSRAIYISVQWALVAATIAGSIAAIVAFWPQITAAASALMPILQGLVQGAWAWLSGMMTGGTSTAFLSQLAAAEGAVAIYLGGPALAVLAAAVGAALAALGALVMGLYSLVQSTYQYFIDCQTNPQIGNGVDGKATVSCAQSSLNGTFDPNIARSLCTDVVNRWVTGYRRAYGFDYWTCGECLASPGWCGDEENKCKSSVNACVMATTTSCLAQPPPGGAGGDGGVVDGGATPVDGGAQPTTPGPVPAPAPMQMPVADAALAM